MWAAKGHDKKTLGGFFDLLGDERCALIRLVSCDAAEWISEVVEARCENATVCLDAFHLVKWVTDALDQVRRDTWNEARRAGMNTHARDLKHARYALWKNPEDLTARQEAKLAWVAKVNTRLYRAYLLKEQFRAIIAVKGRRALRMLKAWLAWAARSRIPAFVELGRCTFRLAPLTLAKPHDRVGSLGHHDSSTTLRTYSHLPGSGQRAGCERRLRSQSAGPARSSTPRRRTAARLTGAGSRRSDP